jgi:hypothetical protein
MKWSFEGESDEVETMYRVFTGQPPTMVTRPRPAVSPKCSATKWVTETHKKAALDKFGQGSKR